MKILMESPARAVGPEADAKGPHGSENLDYDGCKDKGNVKRRAC